MISSKRSLSVKVIATLILVATLVLLFYTLFATFVYRNREVDSLHENLKLTTEQLQIAIAVTLWHYDTKQLERLLDGGMKDQKITGIVVKFGSREHARSRNATWQSVVGVPVNSQSGQITFAQKVVYLGEEIGTLTLFATTKFLDKELITNILFFSGSILVLDIILILSLYGILFRIVLEPLKKLKDYAVSVSHSDKCSSSLKNHIFCGEMEVLRSSLEEMLAKLEDRYVERQQEARRFKESEERFRSLINAIPDLVWLKNKEGIYLVCNEMFRRLFGAKESDIVGKTDYDFVDKDLADSFRKHDRIAMEEKRSRSNEEWVTSVAGGQPRLLDTTKTPLFDTDGKMVGVLGVARDITQRKQNEEERIELQTQLSQMQKMESVGQLAGGMAHNFNNNLAIILGNIELSQLKLPRDSEAITLLENAKIAVLRSRDLVRQILIYSRKGEHKNIPVRLSQIFDETLELLRSTIPMTVNLQQTTSSSCQEVSILGNPSQIQEALINLCNNAVHAMDEKGNLEVSLETVDLLSQDIPLQYELPAGRYAKISVHDDGSGMSEKIQEKIFDPFYTTKGVGHGTGMGLSSVAGIVDQHAGWIKVESAQGCGSTFDLYLPTIESSTISISKTEQGDIPQGKERILFLDDDEMLSKLGEQMLSELGYQVTPMLSSQAALGLFKANPALFDLVITDQTMPELSGTDFIKELLRIRPDLPCILCTGYSSKVSPENIKEIGVKELLMKPFEQAVLARAIRRALN